MTRDAASRLPTGALIRRGWWLLTGLVVALVSAAFPLSSDEGAWLAISRKVAGGGTLYVDAIDNKSPLVFGVTRVLDMLPGPFEPWRAVLLGLLAVTIGVAVAAFAARSGVSDPSAAAIGSLIAVVVALQAVFVLTIEMMAIALVAVAVTGATGRHATIAGAAAGVATAFDPRALVLIPGVIWLASRRNDARAALTVGVAALVVAGAWWVAVLVQPDWRFALIDLNIASRAAEDLRAAEWAASLLRSLVLPVVGVIVFAWLGRGDPVRAPSRADIAIVSIPALAVVLASRLPFDHYWILLAPAVALILARAAARSATSGRPARAALLLLVLALAAPGAHAFRIRTDQASLLARYDEAAAHLDRTLAPGATFVQFLGDPFLAAELPERFAGRSPLLGYLTGDHDRHDEAIAHLRASLETVAAIVDDGGLSVPREAVRAGYRPVRDVFMAALDRFPCRVDVGGLTIRYRTCP